MRTVSILKRSPGRRISGLPGALRSRGSPSRASDAETTPIYLARHSAQARARVPARGSDLEYQISIGFMEAIAGLKTQISVNRRRPCSSCSGNVDNSYRGNACMTCGGSGRTERIRGQLHFSSNCTECGGDRAAVPWSVQNAEERAGCGAPRRLLRIFLRESDPRPASAFQSKAMPDSSEARPAICM